MFEAVEPRRLMAAVAGNVFNDANANGRRDAGEAGAAGQTVYADYNYSGTLDAGEASATTAANGSYSLDAALKSFALRVKPTSGATQTSPASNGPQYFVVKSGALYGTGTTFGVKLPTSPTLTTVSGTVYNDADRNYRFDASEAGVGGLVVYADNNVNNVLDAGEPRTTTDAGGHYSFSFVGGGGYDDRDGLFLSIIVQPPTGFQPWERRQIVDTDPHVARTFDNVNLGITPTSGPTVSSVQGFAYIDTNGSGGFEAGKPNVAGVTVYADYNNNGLLDTGEPRQVTTSNGNFDFDVRTQSFTLRMVAPAGFTPVSPADSQYGVTITSPARQFFNFGFQRSDASVVAGSVFSDANNNGKRDSNETGAAGRTVFADYNYNGTLDNGEASAVTDASGNYTLSAAKQSFALTLLPAAGSTQTSPANNGVQFFVVNSSGQLYGTGTTFGVSTLPTQTSGIIAFLTSTALHTTDVAEDARAYSYFFADERDVWVDLNHNATRDAGEPTFTWQIVPGYDADVRALKVAGLPYGDYSIALGKGTGVGTTAALTKTVTVGTPTTPFEANPVEFFDLDPVSPVITGSLFYDVNANGARDGGESLLDGGNHFVGYANVFADYNFDGKQDVGEPSAIAPNNSPNGFSDFNGLYVLKPQVGRAFKIGGTGVLTFVNRALKPSTPSPVMTIAAGDPTRHIDVGFYDAASPPISPTSPIQGIVFHDNNGNGRFDAGDGVSPYSNGVFADTNYNGILDPNEARAYVTVDLNGVPRYVLNAPIAPFALRSVTGGTSTVYYYEVHDGKLVGYGTDFALS